MDPGGDGQVAEAAFSPDKSLISQSKNEDFGDPNTTTLLPLDATTLEVICRVNLPGVPITGTTADEYYEVHQLIDVKRLSSALDQAMKEHKGTISQVPKVTVGLEQWEIPLFREEGQIESIRMAPQPDTHTWRRFWADEVYDDAVFEAAYGTTDSRTCSTCAKEVLTWMGCYDYTHKFPESGIYLRCKELGDAELTIALAHKSSLWPTAKTFTLCHLS
ncbi:hypothetical protein QBC45DRAFT_465067 [Copromyces sp. CBS 386.78]|nr:hypothetical protein QBC45DRAFT_465067 [Copromyces sp. CBS 386.78]